MREQIKKALGLLLVQIYFCTDPVYAQFILTPPYFNIAENRPITANATCGEGTNVQRPERYCKLVGFDREESSWSNTNTDKEILGGQVCDVCYAPDTEGVDFTKTHGPKNAVDGDISTWWQSPPISRGRKYNRVDLEIDLLQTFQVAYVVVTMADSPRPGVWSLEKSVDGGKTYTAWQYFAGNDAECQKYFGMHANMKIKNDDDVICVTEFSKVLPIEGGEIFVPLTQGRPSQDNIQASDLMMNWLRATNIRLRLMHTKTMLGHLMSVAQGDQSTTRRYYYSIKEISVGGRCVCNGHAYVCPPSPLDPNILQCECLHNTIGLNCDQCAPGFTQKPWRRFTKDDSFECEPCNCNGHSNKCHYNQTVDALGLSMDISGMYEGGGVCEECKDYTTGINCNTCIEGFYRGIGVLPNDTTPCVPCDCGDDPRYTGSCAAESGECECKPGFRGADDCSACAEGYYDYPDCKPCDCFPDGTELNEKGTPYCVSEGTLQCPCRPGFGGEFCDECAPGFFNFPTCSPCECNTRNILDPSNTDCDKETGQCVCDPRYSGLTCEECNHGFFNYPQCTSCNCDPQGSVEEVCSKQDGTCLCKDGYGGERCDRCSPGFFGYPDCKPCKCSQQGSNSEICNEVSGQCPCYSNYAGRQCDTCTPGYYSYPDCKMCGCNSFGSMGLSCDNNGHCSCLDNFMGIKCDQCAPERFNFPLCEECNCDPKGVADDFFQRGGCGNVPKGELCSCKEKVTDRTCNECKPLYWNLQKWRPDGCEGCDCYRPGTIGGLGVCDLNNGQCACKPAVDGSRKCDECKDGFFKLSGNKILGCDSCNCDMGGTDYLPGEIPVCNKDSGACACRYGMEGRRCNDVQSMHYVPTLFQNKFEVEDGYRADGSLVRFAYDQAKFPNFSWRGYAAYSPLQKQVLQDITLDKSSLYQMVLRYQNPNSVPITGTVKMSKPESDTVAVFHKFVLDPTYGDPAFVTVSGETGIYPSPFDLEPGQWTVSLNIDNNDGENAEVLVDYFVLVPNEFTEPRILRYDVRDPCLRDGSQDFCRDYIYPVANMYPHVDSLDAVNPSGAGFYPYTGQPKDLKNTGVDHVVQIANFQPELKWTNVKNKGGPHAIVLAYFTPDRTNGTSIGMSAGQGIPGEAYIYDCPFKHVCRQVVTDPEGRIAEFNLTRRDTTVSVRALSPDTNVAIDQIYLIPIENWSPDLITPFSRCVKDKSGNCMMPRPFPVAPDDSNIFIPEKKENEARPRYLTDDDVPLLKIGGKTPVSNLGGEVPKEGAYVIVAQYYQPDHPEVIAKVSITDGRGPNREGGDQLPADIFNVYEAILPLPLCASKRGCRQPVQKSKDDPTPADFQLTELVDIQFTTTGPEEGWIEYILAVPADEFVKELLVADDSVDRRGEYIQECGKNSFYIPSSVEDGFCKASVVSVSSDFNDGALKCDCNPEGSQDQYTCEKFGGQCFCKSNVIGRSCERCAPGFFGFPNCKQCNCPSTATCNEETGDCICAPFVTGTPENPCSQCEENTFGYDPITGCQECKCLLEGTIAGNMSCTQESGQCACKDNVEGRTCDHCTYGSYQYPDCQTCDCDISGTTERICDQSTAECLCKPFVGGEKCDSCQDGYFNLQDNNPDGCTKCFCFGKTKLCSPHPSLKQTQIFDMSEWTGVSMLVSRNPEIQEMDIEPLTNYGGVLNMDFNAIDFDLETKIFYFSSPPSYAGSHIGSYGSNIKYNISYYGDTGPGSKRAPDVVLMGADSFIFFYSGRKVEQGMVEMRAPLEPRYWVQPSGNPVSRSNLMVLLNSLQRIYIRGSYSASYSAQSRIENVILETTQEDEEISDSAVQSVELCTCPEGYEGSSCEMCSPGYWSETSDKWGPICRRCNCNGHADVCHPVTGECAAYVPISPPEGLPYTRLNFCHYYPDRCVEDTTVNHCSDNTRGRYCELCEVGYYGDATQGGPEACQACPCPRPENNFAESCDELFTGATPEEQFCTCKPNYVGDRCESCGAGYYGNLEEEQGFCKPCSCNGNINVTDPVGCNHITGLCELCLFNSYGEECERCEPWFFGDAISAKNCEECDCNRDGTEECDHINGQCKCFPGVEGERCDRCQADHFGFKFGGCSPCECSEASVSSQCDLETGQCICRPGVVGAKCSRCLNGFWNLSPSGCESCGCNTDFAVGGGCNQVSGQCECLPGVIGQNCDRCPENWILVMNETRTVMPEWKQPFNYDEGCFPCSSCVEDLMESTNAIINTLSPIMEEFRETEKSFYAYRRLNFIGNEIARLKPEIALLDPAEGNRRVKPLEDEVNNLHWTSKSLNIDFKQSLMDELSRQAEAVSVDGSNAVAEMGEVGVKIMAVIKDVKDVSEYLGEGAPTKELLDTSIKTGRDLLESMQNRELAPIRDQAVEEREKSRNLVEKVKEWSKPVNVFKTNVNKTDEMLTEFESNLNDLYEHALTADQMSTEAQQGNFQNSAPQAQAKIGRINQLNEESKKKDKAGRRMITEAEEFIKLAKDAYQSLDDKKDEMDEFQDRFSDRERTFESSRENIFELEGQAAMKAEDLAYQANELETIAERAKLPAENALQAAMSYENILNAVSDADMAAKAAYVDAEEAFVMSDGVAAKANVALKEIEMMYDDAVNAEATVQNVLIPDLANSVVRVQDLSEQTKLVKQNLGIISKQIEKMGDLSSTIKSTKDEASKAQTDAHDALTSINARASEISQNKERAYQLRNEYSAMNLHLANTEKALRDYVENPGREKRDAYQDYDINSRLQRLTERKEFILSTGDRINDLVKSIKEKVGDARGLLAGIENPGVTFNRGSNLEVATPDHVEDLALKTDVSFYMNISNSGEDNERDFLFYLGNLEETYKKIPSTLTDDYMALQVGKEGHVTLTMDLGAGPLELRSNSPVPYNDWVKVDVSRRGYEVNLSVSTEKDIGNIETDTVSDYLPYLDDQGQPFGSVFNLHQEYSRIFVGGFPTEKKVQSKITSTDMEGQVEGLKINGKPVGLWNLKSSKMISGASTRNKFNSVKENEARFSGDGYISLDPTNYYTEGVTSSISLRVRPQSLNGLIFVLLREGGDQFLALELQDGYLSLKFAMESVGSVDIRSPLPLNLNSWYTINLDRTGMIGSISIDGVPVAQNGLSDEDGEFMLMTDLFIGGTPPGSSYPVLSQGFSGCISHVKIEPDHVDLERNLDSVNTSPSCKVESKNTISFLEGSPGYVRMPDTETNGSISFSFMFRTSAVQGLLLYMVDDTGMFYVSLSMVDGALHLYTHPDNELVTTDLQNQPTRFNDNKWHIVSVSITANPELSIKMHINDYYVVAPYEVQNIPLVVPGTGYSVYYGGLPEKLRPLMSGVSAHEGPFIGCIKDAIMMNIYQNFHDAESMTGASLGECGSMDIITRIGPDVATAVETVEPVDPEDAGLDEYDPKELYNERINTSPEVYGQCKLPLSPAYDTDLSAESGMRFGMKSDSFIEYMKKKLPEQMKEKSRFDLEFKTTHDNGLLLFMKHEERSDFLALFIKNGKLIFSFDCGSGPSHLETPFTVNDGQWHTADISRVGNEGKLVFDSREVKVPDHGRYSSSNTKIMEVSPNLYMGGLDEEMRTNVDIKRKLEFNNLDIIPGFIGCMRKVRFEVTKSNKRRMKSLGRWQKNNNVIPCSEKVEPGYFLGPEGGRIKGFRRFRVGIDFDASMMIKPRNISGLLLAVRGRRDYAILQMVDGAIQFMVDNGRGPISATFKPDDRFQFCNGEWHEIHAVKAKNVVTLSVNKIFAQPGIGVPGVSSTDTNNPLFFGGHPYPARLGLDYYAPFVGCMKDISVEGKQLKITDDMLSGDVHANVCPTI